MELHVRQIAAMCLLGIAGGLGWGCSAAPKHPPAVIEVPAGEYPKAFAAAKDALRDYAFELDRVDAVSGVITTHPRGSSGIATPWIPHTSTMQDTVRGLLERERRTVVVTFREGGSAAGAATGEGEHVEASAPTPASGSAENPPKNDSAPTVAAGTSAPTPAEGAAKGASPRKSSEPNPALAFEPLANPDGPLTVEVLVRVERVYKPGRRVDPTSVKLMSFSSDPELVAAHLEPAFATEERDDPALAANLAEYMKIVLQGKPASVQASEKSAAAAAN